MGRAQADADKREELLTLKEARRQAIDQLKANKGNKEGRKGRNMLTQAINTQSDLNDIEHV